MHLSLPPFPKGSGFEDFDLLAVILSPTPKLSCCCHIIACSQHPPATSVSLDGHAAPPEFCSPGYLGQLGGSCRATNASPTGQGLGSCGCPTLADSQRCRGLSQRLEETFGFDFVPLREAPLWRAARTAACSTGIWGAPGEGPGCGRGHWEMQPNTQAAGTPEPPQTCKSCCCCSFQCGKAGGSAPSSLQKSSLSCSTRMGGAGGDALCMGGAGDSECQDPPDTVPCPPKNPRAEHREPTSLPTQHRAVARGPAIVQGFGFHRASTGGSPTAPSPKAGLGWVTPTQQKGMQLRLGQKEASKGCN